MRAAVVNPLHEEAAQQEQQPAKTRDWNLAKRLLLAAHRYFFAFLWGGMWAVGLITKLAPPCWPFHLAFDGWWAAVFIFAAAGVASAVGASQLKRVPSRAMALAAASLLVSLAHTGPCINGYNALAITQHATVPALSGKWRASAMPAARWACTPAVVMRWTSHAACLCSHGAAAGGMTCALIIDAKAPTYSTSPAALLIIVVGCAWGVSKWFMGEVDSLRATFFQQAAGEAPPGLPPQRAPSDSQPGCPRQHAACTVHPLHLTPCANAFLQTPPVVWSWRQWPTRAGRLRATPPSLLVADGQVCATPVPASLDSQRVIRC